MPAKTKKATFRLHEDVLAAVDQAVAAGAAVSKNAFVAHALARELRQLRRRELESRWQEAFSDPLFLRDVEEVEADFAAADAESARQIC